LAKEGVLKMSLNRKISEAALSKAASQYPWLIVEPSEKDA
jgi:hypothetical protein